MKDLGKVWYRSEVKPFMNQPHKMVQQLVWEMQGGYLQKMMEKFSPTFFNQFLGADFENSRYTGQICMKHPHVGL